MFLYGIGWFESVAVVAGKIMGPNAFPVCFLSVFALSLLYISDKPFIAFLVLIVVSDYNPGQFIIGSSQHFLSFNCQPKFNQQFIR